MLLAHLTVSTMTNHNKLESIKSKRSYRKVNEKQKRSLVVGSIIATLIAISPYIFYAYESVPDEKIWDTFLFTFQSNYYESANIAFWIFSMKGIPLYLLFIWFFTCKHWWYHVLIIPITMFAYQLVAAFITETNLIDEMQLIYLIPLMAIIIPSIYLIRAKMFNKLTSKTMQELEDEFRISRKSFKDFF